MSTMAHASGKSDHKANRLLASLAPADFGALQPHLESVDLPLGKILYEAGDTVQYAYFPHDAILSLVAVLADGNTPEMTTIGREGMLGLIDCLGTRDSFGRYSVQLPGTASRIAIERLLPAMEASPRMRETLLRYVQALVAQTFQIVACNAVHPVEARCCRWILMIHDRVERDELPLTHEFLAEMLGVQRPTVSIVARTLQTAGLITQRRGVITVSDRPGLEEVACECYGTIRRSFERLLPRTYPPP
jgi:CRP-like cAMP-binding protein